MSIQRLNDILALKNQGKTINEITEILNVGKGTVGYYLKKARDKNLDYLKNKSIKILSKEKRIEKNKKISDTFNKKILSDNFESLSFERLRKRVILEQENKCNNCGLGQWLNQPLILELEHKDGNNQNNKRDNLEALCPNCHSLTDTWRGKNKKKKIKVTDDELINKLIKNDFNIRQSLIDLNLTPKGGNYKRVHRLIELYLPK